ncbi:MAG: PAN domain-containing protein [Pseudomonadota bacterium]
MRLIPIASFFAVFSFGIAAAAQTPLIGRQDIAFTGGVYTSLNLADTAACAQACAQDSICMAWTFRAAQGGACELKAVIPHAVNESGAVSGLSSRAPDFARSLAASAPVQPPAEQKPAEFDTSKDQAAPTDLLGGPPADPTLQLRLTEQTPG